MSPAGQWPRIARRPKLQRNLGPHNIRRENGRALCLILSAPGMRGSHYQLRRRVCAGRRKQSCYFAVCVWPKAAQRPEPKLSAWSLKKLRRLLKLKSRQQWLLSKAARSTVSRRKHWAFTRGESAATDAGSQSKVTGCRHTARPIPKAGTTQTLILSAARSPTTDWHQWEHRPCGAASVQDQELPHSCEMVWRKNA